MSALPLNLLAQAVPMLTRHELVALTERLIDQLDTIDGDPDEEAEDPAGETVPVIDDPDLPPEEDDGDPDLEDIDEREPDADTAGDTAWAEWHTLRTAQRRDGRMFADRHEDDEDDDADTSVEDDPLGIDPEEDMCLAGDDGCGLFVRHGRVYWGADNEEPGVVFTRYGIDESKGPLPL